MSQPKIRKILCACVCFFCSRGRGENRRTEERGESAHPRNFERSARGKKQRRGAGTAQYQLGESLHYHPKIGVSRTRCKSLVQHQRPGSFFGLSGFLRLDWLGLRAKRMAHPGNGPKHRHMHRACACLRRLVNCAPALKGVGVAGDTAG